MISISDQMKSNMKIKNLPNKISCADSSKSSIFFDDLKFSNSLGLSSTVSCLFSKEDFVCKFGGNVWNLHQTSYPISLQCNQTWRQKWRVCWFLVVFWKNKTEKASSLKARAWTLNQEMIQIHFELRINSNNFWTKN